MTNLRDWQKKASEKRDVAAYDNHEPIGFKDGFDSRDAEIDLLLKIIEKQSEAIKFYADEKQWLDVFFDNTRQGITADDWEMRGDVLAVFIGGKRARTTQAEVQGLVEKLMGEK